MLGNVHVPKAKKLHKQHDMYIWPCDSNPQVPNANYIPLAHVGVGVGSAGVGIGC